jgi:hypothetical protein
VLQVLMIKTASPIQRPGGEQLPIFEDNIASASAGICGTPPDRDGFSETWAKMAPTTFFVASS